MVTTYSISREKVLKRQSNKGFKWGGGEREREREREREKKKKKKKKKKTVLKN